MKRPLLGRHRHLLFRTYLFLVAGLLAVAALLDFGFGRLQASLGTQEEPWMMTTLAMIERRLAATPTEQREALAREIGDEIGIGVQLLESDDIAAPTSPGDTPHALVDADGSTSFLYRARSLPQMIYLGPIAAPRESILLRLLPPLFYLSIFVVVGLWLRPLLKDLNVMTVAAQRFAADYREPLSTEKETTQLSSLARYLDEMSARVSGLIQSQKELIAALSHEMRTPLARIRFALAVIGNDRDDELKEKLDGIGEDVQEIDGLIASMLDYARLDHPELGMHWQRVPLEPWLAQLGDRCRQPGKTLEITRDDQLETAWMDPRLMALALSNLLANAGRYADNEVRLSIARRDADYVFAVEDDGPGIPEADRDSVFKAFTRLDDSRNRDTGGYGLGLAIVARIASLHGGTAGVAASQALGGAAFSLNWPVRD